MVARRLSLGEAIYEAPGGGGFLPQYLVSGSEAQTRALIVISTRSCLCPRELILPLKALYSTASGAVRQGEDLCGNRGHMSAYGT
jgi:hypothetical protein